METAPNKWEFQAGPGGKAAPPGSFDEQAYNQELKANPNLTREQFIENREGRLADRQATNHSADLRTRTRCSTSASSTSRS